MEEDNNGTTEGIIDPEFQPSNEEEMECEESESLQNNANSTAKAKKRKIRPFHSVRAHSNPLADKPFENTPIRPQDKDWKEMYPEFFDYHKNSDVSLKVEMADIGCGFGGLLVALSGEFPSSLIVGMEIRDKVVNYVNDRIISLRQKSAENNTKQSQGDKLCDYANISVLRTNAMKYLPNFFEKNQLKKLFFLFPDPHFKKANHRRRIISTTLLDEYAHVLQIGGRLYTITDVKDLFDWEVNCLNLHPLFRPLSEAEIEVDVAAQLIKSSSEEGKKVTKNQGEKWLAVYERISPSSA